MSQNKKDRIHWFNMDHELLPPARSKTKLIRGCYISGEYEAFSCESATKYYLNSTSTMYYINKYSHSTNEYSLSVNKRGWKISII